MSAAEDFLGGMGLNPAQVLAYEGLENAKVVYLSGSLVEDLGNPCSDIDVFVIGEANPIGDHVFSMGSTLASIHFHGKRRVDFEFWDEAAAHDLSVRVAALRMDLDSAWFAPKELEFMHRLRIGLPLRDAAEFVRWQTKFDFDKLANALARRAAGAVDDALEDLYGMLDCGDLEVGFLRTRDLIDACCDAYLHSRGVTNTKPKWRSKLLARLNKDELGETVEARFWELQCPSLSPRSHRGEVAAYIERCIRFANETIHAVQGS